MDHSPCTEVRSEDTRRSWAGEMLAPGAIVGDYEVLGPLGSGGMGRVYRVRHVVSKRVDAMKVVLPDVEQDAGLIGRFEREIEVQARLNHPNICALHTAIRIGERLALIMELAEGVPLSEHLKRGPLDPGQAVDYFCQVLQALAHAHEHGVIHRDVKPANIVITAEGKAKLVDFGVAKLIQSSELTAIGMTVGSPYYMSPELITGRQADSRSDIYSAGVTLYEMVTGLRPIQGPTEFAVLEGHLHTNPVSPHTVNVRVTKPLGEAILKALAKDPAERFQTAHEFQAALRSAIKTTPATQHPRRTIATPIAAAIFLAAAAAMAATRWLGSVPSPPPPRLAAARETGAEPPAVKAPPTKPAKPAKLAPKKETTTAAITPAVLPTPAREYGIESWGDVSWQQDNGWFIARGPTPAFYPQAPAGSFVLTIYRRKGNARWVLCRPNSNDYLVFELDNHAFHRKEIRDGKPRELAVARRQSMDKIVTLRIDVSKNAIVHSVFANGAWTVLDDWRDNSADFTAGKFGLWPAGRDELGISNFKFTRAAESADTGGPITAAVLRLHQ
jgi:serine/threonine-protein kinase